MNPCDFGKSFIKEVAAIFLDLNTERAQIVMNFCHLPFSMRTHFCDCHFKSSKKIKYKKKTSKIVFCFIFILRTILIM